LIHFYKRLLYLADHDSLLCSDQYKEREETTAVTDIIVNNVTVRTIM